MDDKLLLQLLKIIKKSKQIVLNAFEKDSYEEKSYIDFDAIVNDVDDVTKDLLESIIAESKTFNRDYETEEQMVNTVTYSFLNINKQLVKLSDLYMQVQHAQILKEEEIQQLLLSKAIEKILNKYLHWAEKLECVLMGMDEGEVIFSPNINDEIKIIQFINENTNQNTDYWLPFLGGFGVGFLFGER